MKMDRNALPNSARRRGEVPTCSAELAPPGTPGEGGDAQAYHTRNGRARGIRPQGNSPFLSKGLLASAVHPRERDHGSKARTNCILTYTRHEARAPQATQSRAQAGRWVPVVETALRMQAA